MWRDVKENNLLGDKLTGPLDICSTHFFFIRTVFIRTSRLKKSEI